MYAYVTWKTLWQAPVQRKFYVRPNRNSPCFQGQDETPNSEMLEKIDQDPIPRAPYPNDEPQNEQIQEYGIQDE